MTVNTEKEAARLMKDPNIESVWIYTNLDGSPLPRGTQYAAFTDEEGDDEDDLVSSLNVRNLICLKDLRDPTNEDGLTGHGEYFKLIYVANLMRLSRTESTELKKFFEEEKV